MTTHRAEWIGMLTSVCVVLGGLLALTVKTQQAVRAGVPGANNSIELDQEWEVLQHKILVLQNRLADLQGHGVTSPQSAGITMLSGLEPVSGQGVIVTLSDSPKATNQKLDPSLPPELINAGIIHDVDVLRVVNELFAAGAEAISVDGQRIGPRTAIRCVGPVVNINQVGCASPFKIQAIGNPETLAAALNLPGGVIQQLTGVGCGVTIEPAKRLMLPAYDGAVKFQYAHPLSGDTKEEAQS